MLLYDELSCRGKGWPASRFVLIDMGSFPGESLAGRLVELLGACDAKFGLEETREINH
jgi:hypothetical protein